MVGLRNCFQGSVEVRDNVLRVLYAHRHANESSVIPGALRSSGDIPACEVLAGMVRRVSTPPKLGAIIGSVVAFMKRSAAAAPPFNSKLSMPPYPSKSSFALYPKFMKASASGASRKKGS
jgi:hypothetical protein